MQEEEEIPKLKVLYDELWRDAKTMIRDMRQSISMYQFSGVLLFAVSLMSFFWISFSSFLEILEGNTNFFYYFNAIFGAFAGVFFLVYGFRLIRWYNKLKKRYAKLLEMESSIED